MAGISDELGINELIAGKSILSRPAEEFENDSTVEAMWAIKTAEHARIYFDVNQSHQRFFLTVEFISQDFNEWDVNISPTDIESLVKIIPQQK